MENMEERLCFACWLHGIPEIGNRTIRKLAEYAGGEKAAYHLSENEAKALLTAKQLEAFRKYQREVEPERLYEAVCQKKIVFAPWFSTDYPKRLLQIPDAPYAVYMQGIPIPEEKRLVAVIGARTCSGYGEMMARRIGRELAERDAGLVSGLARGIDGIGQWAAMEAGGYSVGVPGCGVDICYPRENRKLYERCAAQGLLLSEYAPGVEPSAWHFPARNRLISGLSDAVIVVEAREKSGTIITVDMALEQGLDVFAVPGRLTDSLSVGCNGLIGQGAQLFTSVDEMFESLEEGWSGSEVGLRKREMEESGCDKADGTEHSLTVKIFELCDYYPKSVMEIMDELQSEEAYCDVTMPQLIEGLLELVVSGQIQRRGNTIIIEETEYLPANRTVWKTVSE